jgi:hypothetical protein
MQLHYGGVMEREMLTDADRALSHRIGCLEERDLQAYEVLVEEGPVLQLGDVQIADCIWNRIPRSCIMFAIDMHECGYWGRVPEVDRMNNERALVVGGSVVSRWMFAEQPEFWITTDTSNDRIQTSVFVAHDSV